MEALAALPGNVTSQASTKALNELAEARRLITALINIDKRISAAEHADDAKRAEKLEGKHRRVYRKLQKLRQALEVEPPSCWVNIVTRAEIAGYIVVWDKPRTSWHALRREADNDGSADYPGTKQLVMAILYLAARGADVQPQLAA
jgi:hypothetical protein